MPPKRDREAVNEDAPCPDMLVRHRGFLLRYLRALGVSDGAEDLLQEMWLKARRTAMPAQISRSYLARMAHNMMIDQARSARQRQERDHRWHVDAADGVIDATPSAERSLIARQRLHRVEAALRDLGPQTESILRRHRLDDVPQRRIAEEEGLSLSSVEKHLQKAYRALALLQCDSADDGESEL